MEETMSITSFLYMAFKYIFEFVVVTKYCIIVNLIFLSWYKRFTKSDNILVFMPFHELLFIWVLLIFKPLLVDIVGDKYLYFKILFSIPFIPLIFLTVVKIGDLFKKGFLDKLLRV